MVLLIEGVYLAAMLVGLIWLVLRIVKHVRASSARKEAEARWSDTFSETDFQAFLATLREKRDAQAPKETARKEPDDSPGNGAYCDYGPLDISIPAKR